MRGKLFCHIKLALSGVFPWVIMGGAIIAVVVAITPSHPTFEISEKAWLNSPAGGVSEQADVPDTASVQDSSDKGFEEYPASSSKRQALHDLVSSPSMDPSGESTVADSDASRQQGTLTDKHAALIESLPPPAAGLHKGGVSNSQDSATKVETAEPTNEPSPISSEIQPEKTISKSGPWVVILASFNREEDAERYRSMALTRGIDAVLSRMTVKGRDYWRVQVPGFTNADEAKVAAGLFKEKLRIDDVWIINR
jgi:cell division septation protein DedD